MNFLNRIWLGKVWHLFSMLVLAALIVGIYYTCHALLREAYKSSVSELIESSFHLYRVQVSGDGASVALTQAGQPFRPDFQELAKAPFGLEKLEAYRGALNHHAGIASQITSYYNRRKQNLLLSRRDTFRPDFCRIPASAFDFTNAYWSIEIPLGAIASLQARNLEDFAQAAPSVLLSGRCYSETNSSLVDFAPGSSKEVNAGIGETGDMMSSTSRGKAVPMPPEFASAIKIHFDRWVPELVLNLEGSCSNTFSVRTNFATLPQVLFTLSCALQKELHGVAEAETGSFWLMGRYRWWEMIFWVWFGVMTMGILKLTPHLLGLKTGGVWEPRETLVVFAKLFYAPVLALIIFFMLGFLGFGQNELSEFGRSTLVNLGIAFILGLFPNTSFRIIKDLCTQLFRQDILEGDKKNILPSPVEVRSERSQTDTATLYTVDNLKRNAFAHFTAITK